MALNYARRVMRDPLTPAERQANDASNRRMDALILDLPLDLEREIGSHFYLGGGVVAERRLLAAVLAQLGGVE